MADGTVTIIDSDHCDFTQDDGMLLLTLHCDRLSGRWHAAKATMNGEEKRTPDCFVLNDEVLAAIEDAYATATRCMDCDRTFTDPVEAAKHQLDASHRLLPNGRTT